MLELTTQTWSGFMRQYFSRAAILILIVLLAVLLGRPYLDTLLFAATSPRPIAARSDLAETERATIGLFERYPLPWFKSLQPVPDQ
jgi:hypothetical protein